jgi:hypothetical protein
VESDYGDPTPERGGRRKRFYRLRPEGKRALARSFDALSKMARGLKPKLETS